MCNVRCASSSSVGLKFLFFPFTFSSFMLYSAMHCDWHRKVLLALFSLLSRSFSAFDRLFSSGFIHNFQRNTLNGHHFRISQQHSRQHLTQTPICAHCARLSYDIFQCHVKNRTFGIELHKHIPFHSITFNGSSVFSYLCTIFLLVTMSNTLLSTAHMCVCLANHCHC